ncbi:helix-turn-helix domain-containing protein [Marinomonas rhizomae]|uniref:Phage repressor protein n=1 Tax=Marinomonas rhizomae TaxID=491948 RepID=A0A366IWF0_9GAMM|nr:S24 family peptidase [Marinomonas rhizomae]RBP79131.1 phage repressor protein [Marinomonas rhizomae]RNF70421.1 helix-turn-helix domain-containing protein [Marinomonas rhizomae]
MTIAERVKQKRIELSLTQAELAKRIGISQQSLQKIEDGRTQNPRKLLNLAKTLHCDAEWLLLGVTSEVRESASTYTNKKSASTANFRPIISSQQAAQWPTLSELEKQNLDYLEVPESASASSFWLNVVGNSMMSASGLSVPEGYFILVEPCLTAKNGDLIITKLPDSQDVTFKQLVIDAGCTYLTPLNPNYRPIEAPNNLTIIGVVTQAQIVF